MPINRDAVDTLQRFFDAYFVKRAIDPILQLLETDIVWIGPFANEHAYNKRAVKRLLEKKFRFPAVYRYRILESHTTMDGDAVICTTTLDLRRENVPGFKLRLDFFALLHTHEGGYLFRSLQCSRAPDANVREGDDAPPLLSPQHMDMLQRQMVDEWLPSGFVSVYREPGLPIHMINQRMCRTLDYDSREDLIQASDGLWERLIHPDDLATIQGVMEEHRNQDASYEMVYRMRTGNGSYIWVRDVNLDTVSRSGQAMAICLCVDITDRVAADLALEQSRQRLAQQLEFTERLYQSLPCGVIQFELFPSIRPFAANTAALRYLGLCSFEELAQAWDRHFLGSLSEESWTQAFTIMEQVKQTGDPHAYENPCTVNGQTRWMRGSYSLCDADEQRPLILSTFFDITEQVEMERQAQHILDSIPSGHALFKVNADGKSSTGLYYNPGFDRLMGYAPGGFQARYQGDAMESVHPEDRDRVGAEIRGMVLENRMFDCTYRLYNAQGQYQWVNLRAFLVERKPDHLIACGSYTDLDLLKSRETELLMQQMRINLTLDTVNINLYEYDIPTKTLYPTSGRDCVYRSMPGPIPNVPDCFVEEDMVHPSSIAALHDLYARIDNGAKTASADILFRDGTDGQHMQRITFATVFDDAGRPIRAIGLERNVDDLLALESRFFQLEQTNQSLRESFVATYRINVTRNLMENCMVPGSKTLREEPVAVDRNTLVTLCSVIPHPEQRQQMIDALSPERLLHNYQRGQLSRQLQYQRQMPDGSLLWVNAEIIMGSHPDTQDVIAFLKVTDINTEKTSTEVINAVVSLHYDFISLIDAVTGINQRIGNYSGLVPPTAEQHDYHRACTRFIRQCIPAEWQAAAAAAMHIDTVVAALEHAPTYKCTFPMLDEDGHQREKTWVFLYLDQSRRYIVYTRANASA